MSITRSVLPGISSALLLLLIANPAWSEVPEAGSDCVACHNDDGISTDSQIPTISGASEFFLHNQLDIFAAEARPCEAHAFEDEPDVSAENHCAIAEELSDDERAELAGYFSALSFSAAEQGVDEALASRGASIHAADCESCHTESGSFQLDDAGILAGQWKPYLMEQFEHYKAGKRWQPEKMQPVMERLEEADMRALA